MWTYRTDIDISIAEIDVPRDSVGDFNKVLMIIICFPKL